MKRLDKSDLQVMIRMIAGFAAADLAGKVSPLLGMTGITLLRSKCD